MRVPRTRTLIVSNRKDIILAVAGSRYYRRWQAIPRAAVQYVNSDGDVAKIKHRNW